MITKIDDIYLYGALNETVADCYAAKAWLEQNGLAFEHLFYADSSQHQGVLNSISTWRWADGNTREVTAYPFVIYTEIHDDLRPSQYPRVLLLGLDEITNSNLVELYALGR